jgi:dihydropteroate synthase
MTAKDTFFQTKKTLRIGGKIINLSQPKVMGILNLTPDSFFKDSRIQTEKKLLQEAEKMLAEGADFLDLGAYSSRPGATDISTEEEEKRLIPAVKLMAKTFPEALLSIDTFRAIIAEKAIENGAHLINDISGGNRDAELFKTVGRLKVPYVLMHIKGTPQNMATNNQYENMIQEICFYFSEKIESLKQAGVNDIILDPGFGFAKNTDQNFELLKHLNDFQFLGLPILAGLSRKSMIWKSLNILPEQALNGTSILNTIALSAGASILRVHDVKEAKECIKLCALLNAN